MDICNVSHQFTRTIEHLDTSAHVTPSSEHFRILYLTHTSPAMAEQTLNIPQLIVFIIVSVLAIRWYLAKPAAAGTRPVGANRAVRINPAHIDQIASMFPQLNRRDIAWDLQRNGGVVAATTERVLSGRGLDAVSFPFLFTTFAVLPR